MMKIKTLSNKWPYLLVFTSFPTLAQTPTPYQQIIQPAPARAPAPTTATSTRPVTSATPYAAPVRQNTLPAAGAARPVYQPPVYKPVVRATPVPVKPKQAEEAVDLGSLSAEPAKTTAPGKTKGAYAAPPPSSGGGELHSPINFKVYFDLNLYSRPGVSDLTFNNFHSFLFLEASPMPEMQFSFDVNPTPRFYELDYQITPTVQLRAGKIWIPFDDTPFHNIYGGRVNVTQLSLGIPFLPDLWTDLGVGVKWTIADRKFINMTLDAYVVNGFRGSGKDPTGNGQIYPTFSDIPDSADNNADKAFGARFHGIFWDKFGLGASAYTQRWSDQSQPAYRLNIFEGDFQFRPNPMTELRAGIITMKVQIPSGNFQRGGSYVEIGRNLTRDHAWKVLLRGGTVQTDDRVLDQSDERLVGATLIYRPGIIQFSLEHENDIQKFGGKTNYSFTNLRMVVMF